MIVLQNIIEKIKNGSTIPFRIQATNGKKYVAKFPGNPEGKRVLINEYICANLARKLKLPYPKFELMEITNIINYANQLSGIELINGTCYCSEYIEKSSILDDYVVMSKTTNKYDGVKILLFDIMINNNDRNPGNILLNLKNGSLIMIDHSHVFENEALWNEHSLMNLIDKPIDISNMNKKNFNNLLSLKDDSNEAFISEISSFVDEVLNVKEDYINTLIQTIPNDWDISNADKHALKEYLMNRIKRIKEICGIIDIKLKGDE